MIRNIAIIAHVDHGKTTLVDQMLRQAGTFRENQAVQERVLDSNPLERERGITILSKNTSVHWGGAKINIVDTPGHADFGGEVERILRMVDGVLLLVDAFEGPMPQTRFVTRKALALGLQPIVVINKVDRADAEPLRVHDEVLELFLELEADDAQLDAPFLYASARDGYAVREREWESDAGGAGTGDAGHAAAVETGVVVPQRGPEAAGRRSLPAEDADAGGGAAGGGDAGDAAAGGAELAGGFARGAAGGEPRKGARLGSRDLTPLFESIIERVPAPPGDDEKPFQLLVSTIDHSPYLGRLAIGRIERGVVRVGDPILLLAPRVAGSASAAGNDVVPGRSGRVAKLYTFDGLQRTEVPEAAAGEIVALAGIDGVEIGATVVDIEHPEPLAGIAVEEPTVSVDFVTNTSPFAGQHGKYVTSRQLRERLYRELERNVALRVEDTDSPDTFTVSGRGELHLAILMETMRREGYEFAVSRPRVITHRTAQGETLEPYEELIIDVPDPFTGVIIEKLGQRRGEMLEMRTSAGAGSSPPAGGAAADAANAGAPGAGGADATRAAGSSALGRGLVRLVYRIPARGLFGYRSEFLTDTRGEGVLHHRFLEYRPWAGPIRGRGRGVLVSMVDGVAVAYALFNLQDRATLFIGPGVQVYEGMIVGENARPGDMEVNVAKGKKLTNIRAAGSDDAILLEPPRQLSLEAALEFIADDELVEITPAAVRLRKRHLKAHERKKAARRVG